MKKKFMAMKRKDKFKNHYVLAVGYPWVRGVSKPYFEVCMGGSAIGHNPKPIRFPEELWDQTLPKYRLVLERVEGETNESED